MKRCLCLVVLLAAGGSLARAAEPWLLFDGCHWTFPKLCEEWRQRRGWCPDDYCAKPLPEVCPNAKGCVDDYCGKALPCVPANPKGCVDDYCPRSCPLFLGLPCEPWDRCAPPGATGAEPCPRDPPKP